MKRIISIASAVALLLSGAQAFGWSPVEGKMMTRWGKEVSPENVWQSYPRPQLVREDWQNLNGLWQCSVTSKNATIGSVTFEDKILVPFGIESTLSGLGKDFSPEDRLWYKRTFTVDPSWKGRQVMLNFGAVDYECIVEVNGKKVGTHVGGNNSFSMDITKYVNYGSRNILVVSVTDPTDSESDTRGKQLRNPRGIWYTPVSGIWKTVWIEPVGTTSINKVVPVADIATGKVNFEFDLRNAKGNESVSIEVFDGEKQVASYDGKADAAWVKIPNAQLWSPDCPKLYDFKVTLKKGKTVLDKASSYLALRQVSKVRDEAGNWRFALNGKILFQFGPLDQGWWPDGLLTPPSEQAMLYDLQVLKRMGVNTIRKHIKVEPELYYYYADSLGIMLWQDMPSGFVPNQKPNQHVGSADPQDWDAPLEHEIQWKKEFTEMYENLRFFPCITTWIIFNEGWGQFRTPETTEWVKNLDKGAHLINSVTGWTDRNVGDYHDIHNYPSATMKLQEECEGRISSLGEFGGLSLRVEDHLWKPEVGWVPYKSISANLDLMNNYTRLIYDLEALVAQGLSAAIYTQTSDVETELNGYMTYDREVLKLSPAVLNLLHSRLYNVQPASYTHLVERAPQPLLNIKPESTGVYEGSFDYDGTTNGMSVWFQGNATVTLYINGVEVFNGGVRQTRNYNQFNISYVTSSLNIGENKVKVEIKNNTKKPITFNYGITTF